MPVYELINPHDNYHFQAPDRLTAALVAFIVGQGRYGAKEVVPHSETPWSTPFLFGWGEFLTNLGWDVDTDMPAELQHATIAAARTLHICQPDELDAVLSLSPAEQQTRHDRVRSSMADPRRVALSMRPRIKATAAETPTSDYDAAPVPS